ncbi:DUF4397 domain-containing protein [candidate division KSB1 bacterium]|nr:DUF4397 domain-containing protein [candidate division KSB1 bacterium]
MIRKSWFVVLLTTIMTLLVACDDFPFDPPESSAQFLLTHASPDAPNVDVYVDGHLFAKDFAYPNSTRYNSLKEGSHEVKLTVAGTNNEALVATLDVTAGVYYSVFACDAVANLSALVLEDKFGEPAIDEAMVRFAHLSPDAPAVDITLEDDTIVFQNIAFKKATPFTALKHGTYNLKVKVSGTDTEVLEIKDVKLLPHAAYTIWVKGFATGIDEQQLGAEILFHKFLK